MCVLSYDIYIHCITVLLCVYRERKELKVMLERRVIEVKQVLEVTVDRKEIQVYRELRYAHIKLLLLMILCMYV